jgi:hypothetical protein
MDTPPDHGSLNEVSRNVAERVYLGMTLAAMLLLLGSLWGF